MDKKYIHILLIVCFVAFGCETIVPVDLPEHEPLLVANTFFNPDSVWYVQLYKSKDVLEGGDFESVRNASARIMKGDSTVTELVHIFDGYYKSPFDSKPQVGQTYTLIAEAPGLAPVSAKDIIPTPVPINSAEAKRVNTGWDITVNFTDPEGKNYYQIMLLLDLGSGNLFPMSFDSDDLLFQDIDGVQEDEAVFDDALIANQTYSLKIQTFAFGDFSTMYIALLSVSETYFKYIKTSKSQDNTEDNPFASPVQVYSNIEDGLGIFAGFSSSILRVRR